MRYACSFQYLRIKLLLIKHFGISHINQHTRMAKVLLKTARPAGGYMPGCLVSILFLPRPLCENTGCGISLPLIITRVCSVLPRSRVTAIFLGTPLYSWSKVKVRVIQAQKYNSYLFLVEGS